MRPIWFCVWLGMSLVFAACSAPAPTPIPPTLAPTVDIAAIQTQAAIAIFGTQTASVPTATNTPLSTHTSTSTPTRQPTATQTARPTATPLPPVSIPDGWTTYTAVTERFSLAHPAAWKIDDEKPESVSFNTSAFGGVAIGFESFAFSANPEEDVNAWFEYIARSERYSISAPQKGVWDDGVRVGAFVEYASFNDIYDVWGYHIYVGIPTSKGTMFLSHYRAGTKTESDEVRGTLKKLSATIRVQTDESAVVVAQPLPSATLEPTALEATPLPSLSPTILPLSTSTSIPSTLEPKGRATALPVGQNTSDGVTLIVYRVEDITDPALKPRQPGNALLLVEISIANDNLTAHDTLPYSFSYFDIKDEDGFEYGYGVPDIEPMLGDGDLLKGEKARGNLVFEIKRGARGLTLLYKPPWRGGSFVAPRVDLGR